MTINQQILEKNESLSSLDIEPVVEEIKTHQFYNFPKYYDLAFDRDVASDIRFFQKVFRQYADLEVKRVLEPACGPGMFLEALPQFGYHVLGYDLNPAMVEYSEKRLRNNGFTEKEANVMVGDMKNLTLDEKFDAAIICINSLGYIKSDVDIHSHFKAMYNSLNAGGLYIVEISCMCDELIDEKKVDDVWHVKNDGIELELTWNISKYDVANRIRHVDFRMKGNDRGRDFLIEEPHELRLWLYEEFKIFAETNGFKIVDIYNQCYEKIDNACRITGKLGALFFVLKK